MRKSLSFFAVGTCLFAAAPLLAGTQGSATYTNKAGTTDSFEYDFTLHNSGTTKISVFWYAWDDSDLNFLPFVPDNMKAPAGWVALPTLGYDFNSGNYTYGIEWYTFANPVLAGQSLSGFSFESNDGPSVLSSISSVTPVTPGDPPFAVGTSFVYVNYPAQGPGDAGFQFIAQAVPEPATLGIAVVGGLCLLSRRRSISRN